MFLNVHHRQSIRGQGLVETLLIAVLMGVNILAFISFQNYLAYSTELTQQQAKAVLLAKAKIDSLRDFSVINTTSGYTAYQDIATSSQTTTLGNTTYTLSWTVTANTSPLYKNINLTVTWTDRRGNSQTLRFVTNIAGVDPSTPGNYM